MVAGSVAFVGDCFHFALFALVVITRRTASDEGEIQWTIATLMAVPDLGTHIVR